MRHGASQHGISRFELLTAVGILAILAAGILLVRPSLAQDEVSLDKLAAPLTSALSEWRNGHPRECPTLGLVEAEGLLDPDVRRDDLWGGRFRVACAKDELFLLSPGPDGALGTKDDVRILVQ